MPKSDVSDDFFAYFIGLVEGDYEAKLTQAYLYSIYPVFGDLEDIPFEQIDYVERRRIRTLDRDSRASADSRLQSRANHVASGLVGHTREPDAWVVLAFREPLSFPMPFSILGYHPGSVHSSQVIEMAEWRSGVVRVREGTPDETELKSVHEFQVVKGYGYLDFDRWVDGLLGKALDDVQVQTFVLFRFEGVWYGLFIGYGKDDRPISGIYDFRQDRIRVRLPSELRDLAPAFLPSRP